MKAHSPFVFCALLFLTGCASKVWYQPGKTPEEARLAWAQSRLQGAQSGGTMPLIIGGGFAAGYAGGSQVRLRKEIANLSMESKGYQLVPANTVTNASQYPRP